MLRELPGVYDSDADAGGCDLSLPSDVNRFVGSESFMMMPFSMMMPSSNKSSHSGNILSVFDQFWSYHGTTVTYCSTICVCQC